MSAPLVLLIACGIVAVVVTVLMFAIALWAAPRGITGGPAVAAARGLLVGLMLILVIAIAALVWGIGAGWST